MGNLSVTLTSHTREIIVLTLTQTICSIKPNYQENVFKSSLKIEGICIEGTSNEDHLIPLISSEHLSDSPAYFFKAKLEKMRKNSNCAYKLNVTMDSVECIYNKVSMWKSLWYYLDVYLIQFNFVIEKKNVKNAICLNKHYF